MIRVTDTIVLDDTYNEEHSHQEAHRSLSQLTERARRLCAAIRAKKRQWQRDDAF
jgi:hypothetical protein